MLIYKKLTSILRENFEFLFKDYLKSFISETSAEMRARLMGQKINLCLFFITNYSFDNLKLTNQSIYT